MRIESRDNVDDGCILDAVIEELKRCDTLSGECEAERIAWVLKQFPEGASPWCTSFGPRNFGDSRDIITDAILEYWGSRAIESVNPQIQYRYAAISWDLGSQSNRKASLGQLVLESAIALASLDGHTFARGVMDKLEFAIRTAIRMNHRLLPKLRATLIAFEALHAKDYMRGTWGRSFEVLVCNEGACATADEKAEIIECLESRLDRSVAASDHIVARQAAFMLERYYRRLPDKPRRDSALRRFSEVISAVAASGDGGALAWIVSDIHQLRRMGESAMAETLTQVSQRCGAKQSARMKASEMTCEISDADIARICGELLSERSDDTLANIATQFLPCVTTLQSQVKSLIESHPLVALVPVACIDSDGRNVANVGSIDGDLEGRMFYHSRMNAELLVPYLRLIVESMCDHHGLTTDAVVGYLFQGTKFPPQRQGTIRAAVEHYQKKRWLEAIHLFVPQIEAAVRHIVKESGGVVQEAGRNKGMEYMSLDRLLDSAAFKGAFTTRGECVSHYLRVVLSDSRAFNYRNDVSHGLVDPDSLGFKCADLLFHVLLVLGTNRKEAVSAESCQ